MKTKDLVELIHQGAKPIIRFQDPRETVEYEPSPGMFGRIKAVSPIDQVESGTSIVYFTVDFFEFTEKNTSLAPREFYDDYGNRSKTWMETSFYEKSARNLNIYEMYTENSEYQDLEHIEILPEDTPFLEYVNSGSEMTYINWLEDKIMNNK